MRPARGPARRGCALARPARAGAFAVAAVALAAGAHATAGGVLPGLPQLLLLALIVEPAAAALARRHPGPVATGLGLVVSQVLLHGAFLAGVPGHGGSWHSASAPAGMLVWHAGAALALGVLLAHGEELLRRTARLLLPLLPLPPFRPLSPRPRATWVYPAPPAVGTRFPHALAGRGPPPRTAAVPA